MANFITVSPQLILVNAQSPSEYLKRTDAAVVICQQEVQSMNQTIEAIYRAIGKSIAYTDTQDIHGLKPQVYIHTYVEVEHHM